MDPIVTPLFSALLLTEAALGGLGGDKLADALRGLGGNLAASAIDTTGRRLLERLSDASMDPATGLPRNHDLQRASACR